MVIERNGREGNWERPALSGTLGASYELPVSGGGSAPKSFVQRSKVRDVFFQGLNRLNDRIIETSKEHKVEATIARVRLRSNAIAKSHRHSVVFDQRRFQVAGVQQPGEILALVTRQAINGLRELVERASLTQLAQLSAVAEVSPYEVPIDRGLTRSVVTFFDGTLDDGMSLRSCGLKEFENKGVELSRYGKSANAYTASSLPPSDSLTHMPWLRGIRPILKFRTSANLGPRPFQPMKVSQASNQLPLPIVGIIDSGIDKSISGLQRLLVAQESHIPDQHADYRHGSLVGALAATGGGFTNDPDHFPSAVARLIDIQVFGSEDFAEIDEVDLLAHIEDAVERFGPQGAMCLNKSQEPAFVWNLSLAQEKVAEEDLFSLVAMELDRIACENRVVFTVSSGNFTDLPLRGWQSGLGPDRVKSGQDRISPPADSALSVSVGSLSDTSNPPSASPAEHPSPFSRRGPGPGMLVKPEVVHYGGTCGANGEPVQGIRGPQQNGTALECIGTSFAAPRVAAQLAEAAGLLVDPEPELLKLLLLLSCNSRGDHDIRNRDLVNYYGFGFPDSPAALLACNSWECTMLLRGELRPGMGLQTQFPFPASLTENGRRHGHIRMALVYAPVVDSSKGAEYCQTNVSASLGRLFDSSQDVRSQYRREVHPVPQIREANSTLESDLINQGWKWSPTKLYERHLHRLPIHPNEVGWRLSVDLLLRRELEYRREHVRQAFWLGIKISDPEGRQPIYQEMRQQIQAISLAQPIALRQRTSVSLPNSALD